MSVSEALSKSILELTPLLNPNGNEYIPIAIQLGENKLNFRLSVAKLISLVPIPTKQQIGLSNVDNTSDFDKPISSATQAALNNKANTNHNHVVNDITDLLEILSNYELAQTPGTLEEINIGTETDTRSWNPSILHQLIQTLSNKYVGDVPPDTSELKNGTEWFETTTGITYTWYVNKITNKGCFVGDLDPSTTAINNQLTTFVLNFDDNPNIGDEYIKDGYEWTWNGRGWVSSNNKDIPEATTEEAIAATETEIRSWSPAKILTLVENHSSEVGPVIGNTIPLGLNSEGCLVTDSLELTENTTVANAVALMNCILGRIVPKEPTRFPGSNTLSVNSLAQYRITDFVQTDNANDNLNVAGGTTVNTKRVSSYDTNIIPETGPGKDGTVSAYKNKIIAGSKTLTTDQDPITLLGSDNGTFNDLVITNDKDCSLVFTSIPSGFYQIINVKANGNAVSGWNQIYIKHTKAGETNKVNWYVDLSSPGVPVFSNVAIINPSSFELAYSSTIPHLTTNNIFTLSFDLNRFSGDTYPLTDTYLTGVAAGAFLTPASKTYQDSNIKTPLDRNYCVSSGYKTITTTIGIRTGFGSSNLGPTLNTNNSYHAASQNFDPNAIILYKTGNSVPIDETNIAINSVGIGSGNGVRIINPGNSNTPIILNTTVFNSQNGPLQNYDATVAAAVLKHDQTNYSNGYLPIGPNLSQNRSGSQYFTFKFIRTVVAKFNINYTGTLAGLYIALPGSNIDNTSGLNGWLDASLPYNGIGLPGTNPGGNGSDGCSVAGVAILNSNQNNKSVTVTFGTENSSNTLTNEILVRIKLTSSQSLTGFSINPATN